MQTTTPSKHYTLKIAVLTSLLIPLSQSVFADITKQHPTFVNEQIEIPKIQLAILLDTSSSMSGLIDQTRNQLWQVVNEFSTAKQNGVTPTLEIALFEYWSILQRIGHT